MRTKAQSQKTEFLRLDFLRAEVAPLLIFDIFRAIFSIDSNVEYCALLVQAWTEYGFRLTRKVSAWGGKPVRVLRGKRTQGAATAVGHGEKRWQNTGRRFLRQLCDDMVAL